jgi:hypothetical protein
MRLRYLFVAGAFCATIATPLGAVKKVSKISEVFVKNTGSVECIVGAQVLGKATDATKKLLTLSDGQRAVLPLEPWIKLEFSKHFGGIVAIKASDPSIAVYTGKVSHFYDVHCMPEGITIKPCAPFEVNEDK